MWRPIDRIVAAGTTEQHEIHEPLGEIESAPQHAELLAQWNAGRAAYREGRFEAALACFRATASLSPDDGPSRVFIERCTAFLRDGTPRGLGRHLALRPEIILILRSIAPRLRSAQAPRCVSKEGSLSMSPILRDAALRAAPQDEVVCNHQSMKAGTRAG